MICLPTNLVSIDCETTGLDWHFQGIVSIGAVTLDGCEFYHECRPGNHRVDVDPEALAVNGCTDLDELYNRPLHAGNAVLALCEWLRGRMPSNADRKQKYVHGGKNPVFDQDFLIVELMRWRHRTDPFAKDMTAIELRKWAQGWLPLSRRPLNVHDWTALWALKRGINIGAASFSLAAVYEQLGFAEEAKPHNALTGAKLAMEKFKKLAEEF
jgi:hypothetical protein